MVRSSGQSMFLASLVTVLVGCTGAPPPAVAPGTTAPGTTAPGTTGSAVPVAALPFADPAAALLPAADRAELQLVLDNVVRIFQRDPQSSAGAPGITAAVVTPAGRWSGAAGAGGDSTPLVTDAMMNIASITKTFTAAEVVRLAQRGIINLDAPASRYLDHPLLARNPTVRQLLSMRSGVAEHTNEPFLAAVLAAPSRSWTAREALSYANEPLKAPGAAKPNSAARICPAGHLPPPPALRAG